MTFLILLSTISYGVNFWAAIYAFITGEFLLILYMLFLVGINKSLDKADNPTKYKESTDWFYEKYDENEKWTNRND